MNWDYIAGFFDGEGNIHISVIRSKTQNNKLKSIQLVCRLYNSNQEILTQIKTFLGFGTIYLKKKEIWELVILKKKDVQFFLNQIKDKVILKKGQISYVLNNYSFDHQNNVRFDIDQFRSFVTRKNVDQFRKNTSSKLKDELNRSPVNF